MTGAQLDSILANAQEATAGIRLMAEQLNDPDDGLHSTLAHLDSTLTRLDRIAIQLESGQGSLGRLLMDDTFALRAEGVMTQMELLLADVRENPRRYVRLSIF